MKKINIGNDQSVWNSINSYLYININIHNCSTIRKKNIYIYIYSSRKGSILAFQRVFNDSCEPERWYIQRTDEENATYLVLRVSCYQSSAK